MREVVRVKEWFPTVEAGILSDTAGFTFRVSAEFFDESCVGTLVVGEQVSAEIDLNTHEIVRRSVANQNSDRNYSGSPEILATQ